MINKIKILHSKIVDIAPIAMLLITLMTAVLYKLDGYHSIYRFLPDSIGYSILTNLVFAKLYFRKKYCFPTKIAVVGLLAMNVVSIVFKATDSYDIMYDIYIGLITLITAAALKYFRWTF